MSDFLFEKNAMPSIVERDNFWHVPHALECALHDHQWLRDRLEVVPYCVMEDATRTRDLWPSGPLRSEIMISCPNIANPYYRAHYENLKKDFSDPAYRFYGVQTSAIDDPQVVGTIAFSELLRSYTQSAGFLYTYREPTVCFLPPIEMMIAGGPVIYFKGSLLDQYFPVDDRLAPGRAKDENEALLKCSMLLPKSANYDPHFVSSVIASQKTVRARYLPEDVWPIFDKIFNHLLQPNTSNKGSSFISLGKMPTTTVAIDVYTDQFTITFLKGCYIPVNFDLECLNKSISELISSKSQVTLLCRWSQIPFWHGLLGSLPGLQFHSVDRPLTRQIDKILYSADLSKGRLRFALFHPAWLAFKIQTVFRLKFKAMMTRLRRLWPISADPNYLVLKSICPQMKIYVLTEAQIAFYQNRKISSVELIK
jgi:hypothetical protein